MTPPTVIRRPVVDKLVNLITFVSRDALTGQMPCGKPHSQLPQKIMRTLSSAIAGVRDERPAPKEGDEDFRQRTREYVFDRLEIEDGTGIATAVYVESMS